MSNENSQWLFPGKILFVDDKYEQVESYITKLMEMGMSVQYWDSKSELTSPLTNVRVLVLDLRLTEDQGESKDDEYFFPVAEVLNKISGPYFIIILSDDYDEGDETTLKKVYHELFNSPLRSIGEEVGLEKDIDKFDEFYAKIKARFEDKEVYKLLLAWEQILDYAKDKAIGELTKENFEPQMHTFVKSIVDDAGDGTLSRDFIENMLKITTRQINTKKENNDELEDYLKNIASKDIDYDEYQNKIANQRMYYKPDENEGVWTGDIYQIPVVDSMEGGLRHWKYVIVLTPVCDVVNEKTDTYLLCPGFSMDHTSISRKDHPYRKINEYFRSPSNFDSIDCRKIQNKINKSLEWLPKRYYTLWNFSQNNKKFHGICFSFERVITIKKEEFSNMEKRRICRLDSPFVEELQQKFSVYSTRLGTPRINTPPK